MSDEGWGEPQFSEPAQQPDDQATTVQPSYSAPPPEYGQQQPPSYGQQVPPPYTPQQPQQPVYGQQPGYIPAQQRGYGQPQFGQPQFGQPQDGRPQGGPQYGQPYGAPQSSGSKKGLVFGGLGLLVVAGIVVAVLFVTGVFGGSSDGGTPAAAVTSFLSAVKSGNVGTAKSLLCSADRKHASELNLDDAHLVSYSVGKTRMTDKTHATVATSARSASEKKAETIQLPVVKQSGAWKVCFSDLLPNGGAGG